MKSEVLNVSIDTETPNGELLKNLLLSNDYGGAWMCASWVDRTKYNPVELLKQSEESRMKAVEEAIRLNGEVEKMAAWIEKALELLDFHDLAEQVDEAPI